MVDIKLAAAFGLADMDRAGGSIAGAVEASRIPEGLQEHGTPPAAVVAVLRQRLIAGRCPKRGSASPPRPLVL